MVEVVASTINTFCPEVFKLLNPLFQKILRKEKLIINSFASCLKNRTQNYNLFSIVMPETEYLRVSC